LKLAFLEVSQAGFRPQLAFLNLIGSKALLCAINHISAFLEKYSALSKVIL
jgi:hypothetical protein